MDGAARAYYWVHIHYIEARIVGTEYKRMDEHDWEGLLCRERVGSCLDAVALATAAGPVAPSSLLVF